MRDNHTFTRLDTILIDEAMDRLKQLVNDQGGYGFVGTKGVTPPVILQWHPGEAWREKVRSLLLRKGSK